MVMSATRWARDRAIAADQSTMAEERVVLAGVSDRAAVAGQTQKHIVKVCLKASRNRPVTHRATASSAGRRELYIGAT
jgi:hypothetical protein